MSEKQTDTYTGRPIFTHMVNTYITVHKKDIHRQTDRQTDIQDRQKRMTNRPTNRQTDSI